MLLHAHTHVGAGTLQAGAAEGEGAEQQQGHAGSETCDERCAITVMPTLKVVVLGAGGRTCVSEGYTREHGCSP